eukprot:COSAG02_NODE_32_length_50374_cov_46.674013_23_plen_169_part_00
MLNKFHASGATASYNQCNRIRSDAKSFSSVLSNGVISDAKSISSVYRTVEQRYGTTGTGPVVPVRQHAVPYLVCKCSNGPAPSHFETARKEPPDTKCAPVQRLAVDRAGPGPTSRWLWSHQSASRRWRAHWVAGCELPELCGPQRCGGQKAGVRAEWTGQALVAEPKL